MCNLSEGLIERAEKRGERRGKRKAVKKAGKKFKVLEEENRQAKVETRQAKAETRQKNAKLGDAVVMLLKSGYSEAELREKYSDDFSDVEFENLKRKALLS